MINMKRVRLTLLDDRFRGECFDKNVKCDICPAKRVTTTGWLWWKKRKEELVYCVMVSIEEETHNCYTGTDFHNRWHLFGAYTSFETAKGFRDEIVRCGVFDKGDKNV